MAKGKQRHAKASGTAKEDRVYTILQRDGKQPSGNRGNIIQTEPNQAGGGKHRCFTCDAAFANQNLVHQHLKESRKCRMTGNDDNNDIDNERGARMHNTGKNASTSTSTSSMPYLYKGKAGPTFVPASVLTRNMSSNNATPQETTPTLSRVTKGKQREEVTADDAITDQSSAAEMARTSSSGSSAANTSGWTTFSGTDGETQHRRDESKQVFGSIISPNAVQVRSDEDVEGDTLHPLPSPAESVASSTEDAPYAPLPATAPLHTIQAVERDLHSQQRRDKSSTSDNGQNETKTFSSHEMSQPHVNARAALPSVQSSTPSNYLSAALRETRLYDTNPASKSTAQTITSQDPPMSTASNKADSYTLSSTGAVSTRPANSSAPLLAERTASGKRVPRSPMMCGSSNGTFSIDPPTLGSPTLGTPQNDEDASIRFSTPPYHEESTGIEDSNAIRSVQNRVDPHVVLQELANRTKLSFRSPILQHHANGFRISGQSDFVGQGFDTRHNHQPNIDAIDADKTITADEDGVARRDMIDAQHSSPETRYHSPRVAQAGVHNGVYAPPQLQSSLPQRAGLGLNHFNQPNPQRSGPTFAEMRTSSEPNLGRQQAARKGRVTYQDNGMKHPQRASTSAQPIPIIGTRQKQNASSSYPMSTSVENGAETTNTLMTTTDDDEAYESDGSDNDKVIDAVARDVDNRGWETLGPASPSRTAEKARQRLNQAIIELDRVGWLAYLLICTY